MSAKRATAATVAASVVLGAAATAGAAVQTDAQVKAAVQKAIAAATSAKGTDLAKAVVAAKASLTAATPTSAAGKQAKTLAQQGLAKEALAASEQVKADAANTKMQYPTATAQTALATKNLKAALVLLHKAAAMLH